MGKYDYLKPLLVKAAVLLLGAAGGLVAASFPIEFGTFCKGIF